MTQDKWLLAFRYSDMETAGEAWETCRDLVFGLDIDASAYRIQLNTVAHVIIIGDGPLLRPVRDMFERSCAHGKPAELPTDVKSALFERRNKTKIPGAFWQRRSP